MVLISITDLQGIKKFQLATLEVRRRTQNSDVMIFGTDLRYVENFLHFEI